MRRLITVLCSLGLACACMAGDQRREVLTFNVGTNASGASTQFVNGVIGELSEVAIDIIAATTANVAVVVVPELTTMSTRNVYTNAAVTADTIKRPLVQANDTVDGAVISGQYMPIMLNKDAIRVIWQSDAATGIVGKVVLKYEKGE